MPQELVDNQTFLTRLESAFKGAAEEESRAGSIWLTHKRYTYSDSAAVPHKDEEDVEMDAVNEGANEYDVLIRCTNGADVNFSTRIPPTLLPQFHTLYATHLRATFAPSMIKRDKKKEKVKAEKRETWKKQLAVDVRTESRVEGSGKKIGHRQRARRLQAQRKKEAQREELEERERTSTRPVV